MKNYFLNFVRGFQLYTLILKFGIEISPSIDDFIDSGHSSLTGKICGPDGIRYWDVRLYFLIESEYFSFCFSHYSTNNKLNISKFHRVCKGLEKLVDPDFRVLCFPISLNTGQIYGANSHWKNCRCCSLDFL